MPAPINPANIPHPADKVIIDDRMAPMFAWLDNLSMQIDNEHILRAENGNRIPGEAARLLAELLAIAAVPRAQQSNTLRFQAAKNYARTRAQQVYG